VFNSKPNSLATSAALAELCALVSVNLVTYVNCNVHNNVPAKCGKCRNCIANLLLLLVYEFITYILIFVFILNSVVLNVFIYIHVFQSL